jgi:hypothetical protein
MIDEVVSRLTGVQGARSHRTAVDQVAAVASAVSSVRTSGEYVRLSPASRELLAQHGAIPGEGGYFRMFVHDTSKRIAGQLQWEKVNLGAEQALSLQMSAIGLALRAAILEVQQSVERVESKVDQVTKLMRAERVGDAVGDHRTLTSLTDRVRQSGRIGAADWSTVAAMGPQIGRDVEALRAHIRTLLQREGPGRTTWGRAGEAEHLIEEDWLEETLALLAVVEHNFTLWQELRIAHVGVSEPTHLLDTVVDARRQLESQRQADQQVLDALIDFATVVADPRLLDGLDLINAARLKRARHQLDKLVQWFADGRLLDAEPLATEPFPNFLDSVRHLKLEATRGISGAATILGGVVRRSKKSDRVALPPSPGDLED